MKTFILTAIGWVKDFRYGEWLEAAHKVGMVWDEEGLASYVTDPIG